MLSKLLSTSMLSVFLIAGAAQADSPTTASEPVVENLLTLAKKGNITSEDLKTAHEKLGAVPTVPLIDQLEVYFNNDKSEMDKRWLAAVLIGRIGGEPAQEKLVKGLKSDVFLMRMAAIKGIEVMGDTTQAPQLYPLLNDPAMVVRAAVADALGNMRTREALPHLIRELNQSRNFYRGRSLWVRNHIIDAIGKIGGEQSIAPLIACLKETDTTIVDSALKALNPLIGERFVPDAKAEQRQWLSWWEHAVYGPPSPTN